MWWLLFSNSSSLRVWISMNIFTISLHQPLNFVDSPQKANQNDISTKHSTTQFTFNMIFLTNVNVCAIIVLWNWHHMMTGWRDLCFIVSARSFIRSTTRLNCLSKNVRHVFCAASQRWYDVRQNKNREIEAKQSAAKYSWYTRRAIPTWFSGRR